MKDHLNIFEHYSQKDALPIENNSTRNLGIVIKNNSLALYSVLDLISEKSGVNISKPSHPDEWFLKLQVKIKSFAREEVTVKNVIAMTLTTSVLDFYSDELAENETENITDMLIYSKETLIVIEAKRDSTDARKQLEKQIAELSTEFENNGYQKFETVKFISLTWDDVVASLQDINVLTCGKDVILNDYIDHIKKRVPSFFPVQTFNKLRTADADHIKRRIERFSENFGTEVRLRYESGVPIYWIKLLEKKYMAEVAFRNYNEDLAFYLYPGNTKGQGNWLFAESNSLSILDSNQISVQGFKLEICTQANLKISDAFGGFKFGLDMGTKDKDILREIFKRICGKRRCSDNTELLEIFQEYGEIINVKSFEDNFEESFQNPDHDYTFQIALTISIRVGNIFDVFKKIDTTDTVKPENDKTVEFTKQIIEKIYDLIEN